MSITLITAYYDLNKYEKRPSDRTKKNYLLWGEFVLKLNVNIIFFVSNDTANYIKQKRKQYGLLNEKDVSKFNTYVGLINEGLKYEEESNESKQSAILNEYDISERKKSDNIVIDAYKDKKASDIDNMRVIASVQKAFEPKKLEVRKGVENCVIYVTDFTPFSKSQMENLESIFPITPITPSNLCRTSIIFFASFLLTLFLSSKLLISRTKSNKPANITLTFKSSSKA